MHHGVLEEHQVHGGVDLVVGVEALLEKATQHRPAVYLTISTRHFRQCDPEITESRVRFYRF